MTGLGKGRAGHGHGRELGTDWARAQAGLGTVTNRTGHRLGTGPITSETGHGAGTARADCVRTSRVPISNN